MFVLQRSTTLVPGPTRKLVGATHRLAGWPNFDFIFNFNGSVKLGHPAAETRSFCQPSRRRSVSRLGTVDLAAARESASHERKRDR